MNFIRNYILVDDDPFNNILNKEEIESALGEVAIFTFESPEEGLAFIKEIFSIQVTPTILFLDLNMPTLSGWEFIEQFESFSNVITSHIKIYILSSSVNPHDKRRAELNKCISGFISKPLEAKKIVFLASF